MQPNPVPIHSGGRGPCIFSGILTLAISLFGLLMLIARMKEASAAGILWGSFLLLFTMGMGLASLFCRTPQMQDSFRPAVVMRERSFISVLGLLCHFMGLLFTFVSVCRAVAGPAFPAAAPFLGLLGLAMELLGTWALLARRNRTLIIYENGSLIYCTSWGRMRTAVPGQIASIQLTLNRSVVFLDSGNRRLLSVETNMLGTDQLEQWIERQHISVKLTKFLERQVLQTAEAEETVSWREEYRTRWHSHLKSIRIGLVLTLILFSVGSIVPFALYLVGLLKFRTAVSLSAAAPVPFLLYYLIFAQVLLLNARPKRATPEWNAMHIKVPSLLFMFLSWLLSMQFYDLWNLWEMQVVDEWQFLVLWLAVGIILTALFVQRTPKRLRGENLFLVGIALFLLSYPLCYGANLALCGHSQHYSAVITGREEKEDDDGDSAYTLTVLLDDGTEAEIQVTQTLYQMEESGTPFVVCQLESPLGIRMIKLHLPS